MFVLWIIIMIFIVLTIILLSGKGSNLVAGFNTLPQEQKDKFDKKKLSRDTGFFLVFVDIGLIALGIYVSVRVESRTDITAISNEITIVALLFLAYLILLLVIWMLRGRKKYN
ncbi:MAG: DUF3784 domain-containing protein [Lachnotalea sp.]